MRQRYYNTDIKRFINQDILTGTITDSQSLNRYSYVQGNPVNYNDPFDLSPMKILTPYINFVHDALNLVSVIPGPIGYVADAISAGMYYLEGKEKAALKMLVMAGNNIATGGLIGKLSSLGSKGRLLASSFFIGTGVKGMASSGASFVDNFMGLIDSISNGDDILTIFHYASGTVCDAAGMYYGAKAFAGGYKGASSALDDMDTEWYRSRKGHAIENSDIKNVTYEGNKGHPKNAENSSSNMSGNSTVIVYPNKPHKNGTPGHWETILDEVQKMSESGEYDIIYINKGLSNEIPGAKPNRRPDIMGVRKDGLIDQVEIPSKTDTIDSLIVRMMDNQRIIGDRAGTIRIRNIGD